MSESDEERIAKETALAESTDTSMLRAILAGMNTLTQQVGVLSQKVDAVGEEVEILKQARTPGSGTPMESTSPAPTPQRKASPPPSESSPETAPAVETKRGSLSKKHPADINASILMAGDMSSIEAASTASEEAGASSSSDHRAAQATRAAPRKKDHRASVGSIVPFTPKSESGMLTQQTPFPAGEKLPSNYDMAELHMTAQRVNEISEMNRTQVPLHLWVHRTELSYLINMFNSGERYEERRLHSGEICNPGSLPSWVTMTDVISELARAIKPSTKEQFVAKFKNAIVKLQPTKAWTYYGIDAVKHIHRYLLAYTRVFITVLAMFVHDPTSPDFEDDPWGVIPPPANLPKWCVRTSKEYSAIPQYSGAEKHEPEVKMPSLIQLYLSLTHDGVALKLLNDELPDMVSDHDVRKDMAHKCVNIKRCTLGEFTEVFLSRVGHLSSKAEEMESIATLMKRMNTDSRKSTGLNRSGRQLNAVEACEIDPDESGDDDEGYDDAGLQAMQQQEHRPATFKLCLSDVNGKCAKHAAGQCQFEHGLSAHQRAIDILRASAAAKNPLKQQGSHRTAQPQQNKPTLIPKPALHQPRRGVNAISSATADLDQDYDEPEQLAVVEASPPISLYGGEGRLSK